MHGLSPISTAHSPYCWLHLTLPVSFHQVKAHELSINTIAQGELDCPRLFILLPQEVQVNSKLMMMLRPREFVTDRYRLVFLDPVTGFATRSGPDGNGYRIELPAKWLVENRRYIDDGLKIIKLAAAAGQLVGLPLPSCAGLPTSIVSKAEVQAVDNFDRLFNGSADLDAGKKGGKAATGQAYKHLRKLIKDQCNDEYLIHASLKKEKANDGTIEWISEASKAQFKAHGQQSLVWNNEALKAKAMAAKPL